MATSQQGKANLWREGKDGASPGKRVKAPGGGNDFQAPANYRDQFKGHPITGGGGANAPAALDNKGVFANSIAGLEASAKPFMPDPGKGRDSLDMYAVRSEVKETGFGLDMGKEPEGRRKL